MHRKFPGLVAALVAAGALACNGGDSKDPNAKPSGKACPVTDVRIEEAQGYRPPSGRPLPLPKEASAGHVSGATGSFVTPQPGQPGAPAMRLTATGDVAITFIGPHDLSRLESLACIVWLDSKRAVKAHARTRSGDNVEDGAKVGPAKEGVDGWTLFRVPLPEAAVKSAHADELDLVFTGEIAGGIAVETPVLEWVVAPPWKKLLDADPKTPQPIEMSDGTREGFALTNGRVLRARAKIVADGGEVVFSHGSIEPARGKPKLAWFGITVHHADGRAGQAKHELKTRNKWAQSRVPFQGKAGETVDIEIEFVVEGPAALCAAVTVPEVFAP